MAITVTCSCGGRFKAPDEAAGRTARCPSCHAPLVIPAADAESAVQYLELKPGEPPAPEAPPAVAPVGRRANRLGIASLVLGILALLISWIPILGLAAWPLAGIGIILGIVGIVLAARTRRVGYASAITGTVLGVAAIGVTVVVSSLLGRALREARRQADADLAKLQQVAPPAGPLPAPTLLPPEPAKAAAPAAPDGTIAGLDRNGDGRLSADEVPEERRVQFGAIDADRDGYVDAGEWARADEGSPARGQVIAQRLFTVADDFVVDVYHNGERVPIERREMIAEAFGATEEKIDVEVREGDWLVFNVANNRLRWNGWYYFAAAGVNDGEPHIGFTTELDSGRWSYCDDPGQVPAFIAHPRYLADHRALPIATPWDQGDARIKQRVPGWKGVPVWGERRNTWIKFVAPPAASPGAHPEAEPGIPAEAPRAEAEPGPGAGPRPSEERPVKSTAPTAPAIPLGAQPGEVRRFDVGGVEVGAVAWSHDGRSVLCGAHDKLLHLWDVETGAERLKIAGHTDRLTGVAFTPDDRMAVSTGGDFTARVWDLTDGHEVRKFAEHTDLVHSVAITTDGRRVVTGGKNELFLWDLATAKLLGKFPNDQDWIRNLAISADGRSLLSAGGDHTARLWDMATGREIRRFAGHENIVAGVALRRDGRIAVTGSHDKTLRAWDVPTGQELQRYDGHTEVVTDVEIAPDGRFVLSCGGAGDETIRLWELETGRELLKLAGHPSGVTSISFAPDGRRAVSAGVDGTVRIWSLGGSAPAGAARRRRP